jgi:hypothetical protein
MTADLSIFWVSSATLRSAAAVLLAGEILRIFEDSSKANLAE